jgi:hypothetical protein
VSLARAGYRVVVVQVVTPPPLPVQATQTDAPEVVVLGLVTTA